MTRPKIFGETRYCSIDEPRIHGWRLDVAAGRREQGEGEARAALERFIALGLPYCESSSGAEV